MAIEAWKLSSAAQQLRDVATRMSTTVDELTSANVWSGADADRFAREWEDQVVSRMRSAATHLDNVDVIEE
jgi:hypothetical protein